jgi:putative protein-disulfide isomerase
MDKIIYVADPMCSWCWGFTDTLNQVYDAKGEVPVEYVMGGLAKDSDEPMATETVAYVQDQWRKVTDLTGATFNWDFWEKCKPRRSTYPSCRAVIAASRQGKTREMFEAIQRAYYQEARNPADLPVLSQLAKEIGLDREVFDADIVDDSVEADLQDGFNIRRSLQANSFPSLILMSNDSPVWLTKGYADSDSVLSTLNQARAVV